MTTRRLALAASAPRLSAFLRGTSLPPPQRTEDFRGRRAEVRRPPRPKGERHERQYFRIAECERW